MIYATNVTELSPLHKQLGNKIIELKHGNIVGYKITKYVGLVPVSVEFEATVKNDINRVISWDTAYDMLYGKPSAPDFSKVVA